MQNVNLCLQHNLGLGGAVVVALYRLGFPETRKSVAAPAAAVQKNPLIGNNIKDTPEGFLVTPYMKLLEEAMQDDKDNLIEKVRGIYGFKVTNGPKGGIFI